IKIIILVLSLIRKPKIVNNQVGWSRLTVFTMKTLPDPKTRVTAPKHVCSIYRQPEEPLSYLVPFLRAGLERGERCVYIAENKRKFAPVLVALKHAGVAAGAAVRSRALTLVTKSRSRFQDAHFDLRSARSLWREQKANALASGQTG